MSTHISDLLDEGLLNEMVDEGYIRIFTHDNGDLLGYNYLPKAQFEKVWNPCTLQCRGLIVDTDGTVLARPFPKFFNYGEQPYVDAAYLGEPYMVHEKMDGSLGIHYRWEGEDWIATRGSFHSDQAVKGTELFRRNPDAKTRPDFTMLFEILYPGNRIVVDYRGREELVALGGMFISCGFYETPSGDTWRGFRSAATLMEDFTDKPSALAERFEHLNDGNFEGVVLTYEDGRRVKVKLSEYVRLHRFISSLSNRTIWEAMAAGTDLDAIIGEVPDEFMGWVRDQRDSLQGGFDAAEREAVKAFESIMHLSADRPGFAREAVAMGGGLTGLMFAMLDGKDYGPMIWKVLRPGVLEYPTIKQG